MHRHAIISILNLDNQTEKMATSTSKQHVNEISFDHEWVIKNWLNVIKDQSLLENTSTVIICKKESWEYARFLVGLQLSPQSKFVHFYLKLVSSSFGLEDASVYLEFENVDNRGERWFKHEIQAIMLMEKTFDVVCTTWPFPAPWNAFHVAHLVNFDGSLTMKLKLTIAVVQDADSSNKAVKIQAVCKNECNQEIAALLEDTIRSDVKFCTKDKVELSAHKLILSARCPVFSAMFGSDFLENNTGTVIVDDISSKTMKILLKYWYSGELLPSWIDNDIVVEFAYAAGKYQMTRVLEIIDDFLGRGLVPNREDLELLKVVQKLSLKKAEARLLKRVVYKISQASSAMEIFDLFSIQTENLDVEKLSTEEILRAFDDVVSEKDDIVPSSRHTSLLAFACKVGMKSVETKILNRIISTIKKVSSTDDLFELFDIHSRALIKASEGTDLLACAKPKSN